MTTKHASFHTPLDATPELIATATALAQDHVERECGVRPAFDYRIGVDYIEHFAQFEVPE
jgi:hypothetical protein